MSRTQPQKERYRGTAERGAAAADRLREVIGDSAAALTLEAGEAEDDGEAEVEVIAVAEAEGETAAAFERGEGAGELLRGISDGLCAAVTSARALRAAPLVRGGAARRRHGAKYGAREIGRRGGGCGGGWRGPGEGHFNLRQ